MYSMRVTRFVKAPRASIYAALTDAASVATWRVPTGMNARVHEFDARPGGRFRISLSYDAPDGVGKSEGRTDTYHGRFTHLVRDVEVVEQIEFETVDAALRGAMTMTTTLVDASGGTDVTVVHDGIPDVIPRVDNETGTRMALDNLARLVESQGAGQQDGA